MMNWRKVYQKNVGDMLVLGGVEWAYEKYPF